jgi:hypothetical protein
MEEGGDGLQRIRSSATPELAPRESITPSPQPQAPQFLVELPAQLLVAPNMRLVLSTEVTANPQADFSWTRDGDEIKTQADEKVRVRADANRATLVVEPPVKVSGRGEFGEGG